MLKADGSGHRDVDRWTLRHSFLDPDDGTGAAMWLEGITHTGVANSVVGTSLPEVAFDGEFLANRVDNAANHISPLMWRRLIAVTTETGAKIAVDYADQECSSANRPSDNDADINTKRCMPVKGVDPAFANRVDWFHKYVVAQVTETDAATGLRPVVTSYEYVGPAAWHFDEIDGIVPVEKKTWAQWRGYGQVFTRVGDGQDGPVRRTDTIYFRGMDGDRLDDGTVKDIKIVDHRGPGFALKDHDRYAGTVRETTAYITDGGAVLSRTITDPWLSAPTATQRKPGNITAEARMIDSTATYGYHTVWGAAGPTVRTTEVRKTIDGQGRVTQIHDRGDTATPTDDLCTRTEYASNTAANLLNLVTRVQKFSAPCDTPMTLPDDVLSDGRTFYDYSDTFGEIRDKGIVTRVDDLSGWTIRTPTYATTQRIRYDNLGRVVESTDQRGLLTRTTFTPATGPVTRVTTNDPLGIETYVEADPAWGAPVLEVNTTYGTRTRVALDNLGRVAKVWGPTRPDNSDPDGEFGYLVRNNGPIVVTSRNRQTNGNYLTKYELYDGRMRLRQTQIPAANGGRAVADMHYDSRDLLVKRSGPYYNDAPPGFSLLQVTNEAALPNQVRTEYDGAGRATAEILMAGNGTTLTEKWRTTTVHGGDRVHVIPPYGATATETIYDARGRIQELRQLHTTSAAGTYDLTRYEYTKDGKPAKVTDPVGNVWETKYDLLGRVRQTVDPDRGTTTITYNAYDQPETTTDSRGKTLQTTYDNYGRPTETRDITGGGSVKRTSTVYDTIKLGLPTSSTRWVGDDAYTTRVAEYDQHLRPKRTQYVLPMSEGALGGTWEFSSTFNDDGSPASTTMPAAGGLPAETLSFGYNEFSLPTTTTGLAPYVTGTTYTAYAEPSALQLSDGTTWVQHRYYYDQATRRPTNTLTRTQTSNTPIVNASYTYDPAGNLTKVSDSPTGQPTDTQCFWYDNLRRLTTAWTPASNDCATAPTRETLGGPAPYWHAFDYDKVGNRTAEKRHVPENTTATYTYPAAGKPQPHTLTSKTTTGPTGTKSLTFGYDPTGNTTRRDVAGAVQDLEWDVEGKLVKATQGAAETSYLYDADGERLIRRDSTGSTLYLGGMELHRSASGALSATRYYSHGGQTIGVRTNDNRLTWLGGDHHGTHTIAIDAQTQNYERRRSTPFGADRGTAPTWWAGDKGFVGGTRDTSTGYTHLGAREYDDDTGRFLSIDPIIDPADPQQMHGYAYANNNPTTFSDPDGLLIACGPDGIYCGPNAEPKPDLSNKEPPPVTLPPNEQAAIDEAKAVKQKSMIDIIKEQGLAFLLDFLGITDIVNCFTKGDLGACVSTLIGFIPWGKVLKAGKAIIKGIDKAFTAYTAWQKAVKLADDVLKRADEWIAAARKKADEVADAAAKAEKKGGGCTNPDNSFVPGTEVALGGGGTKPIEELRAGDEVLAADPETGTVAARPITVAIEGSGPKALVDIRVSTSNTNGENVITATDAHPFWVTNRSSWRDAGDLEPGDELLAPDGARVTVIAVVAYGARASVHNLTVQDLHTYFVLAGGKPVLVHNCPADLPEGFFPAPSRYDEPLGPVENITSDYRRSDYGGRRATRNPAGNAIVAAAAGTPCPECGAIMIPRTRTSPQPEHFPALVVFHFEHGGHRLTPAERAAYGTSGASLNGANCAQCQRQQGNRLMRYVQKMRKKFGL
ncbi:polymorphic toxin-type HINT domain-containing protein [Virgisporangium aliadipatigenens]|uniref:polymorphic toxin-type HINT domain-containing protein n=1 Tax=Virgisporangium aliadipatigenens TaxID=741659 RepID=UPI001EF187CF|nr:polymorphic toxin-type HINT domain-containing protein [Virgisporangium aliadipatigenens]